MTPGHVHELRIAPRCPDRHHVTEREENQSRDPELQAQPDGSCQRRIGYRQPARCAAQQNMLGQRAMNRNHEAVR